MTADAQNDALLAAVLAPLGVTGATPSVEALRRVEARLAEIGPGPALFHPQVYGDAIVDVNLEAERLRLLGAKGLLSGKDVMEEAFGWCGTKRNRTRLCWPQPSLN